jgi:hypothetical protein
MHGINSNKTYTSNETNIYASYTNEVMPQHVLHMTCMKKQIILLVLFFFSHLIIINGKVNLLNV